MIARPKISRNEWKMAERGAFEVGNFAPLSCPGANIKEMKGRATVDHLWETMGSRPKCVNDLHWIEVAREQAALEEAHHRKLAGETA